MGDVLMNLPAIHLLRQTWPKSRITLLVDESLCELFATHPDLDDMIAINADDLKRSFLAKALLVKTLRARRFDLAVVSNPDKWMHAAIFLGGISERVGYACKWGFFLTRKLKKRQHDSGVHEIEKNLALTALVTQQTWDGKLDLPRDPAADQKVRERIATLGLGDAKILAIHPGTSNPRKRWPQERWVELCGLIGRQSLLRVLLIGGPEEVQAADEILARSKIKPADWTGRSTLRELTAFFRQPEIAALVSADSGPVHVAWMSGTPVVALYAKGVEGCDPARWGPRDGKSEVIYKPIGEIRADEVLDCLKKVLGPS